MDLLTKEPHTTQEPRPATHPAGASARAWLFKLVPAFDSLRTYSLRSLRLDLVAGLTVAAVAVPQAMAYASIPQLPVQYGLYTAIIMTAVGALLDSSKQLINGPTNAICIALASAIVTFPPEQRLQAAILMAFLIGVIQTAITLFAISPGRLDALHLTFGYRRLHARRGDLARDGSTAPLPRLATCRRA
jgi:hypothetical protein